MVTREERGLEIAATARLTKKGDAWIVTSPTSGARYTVGTVSERPHCTCPDHETRGAKCKHIWAVEQYIQSGGDLEIAPQTSTIAKKAKTYPQDWRAYNAAQTHEKERFLNLLADLCAGVCTMSVCDHPTLFGRCYAPLANGWHAHHKHSVAAGGSDDLSNCLAMCVSCHERTRTYGRR